MQCHYSAACGAYSFVFKKSNDEYGEKTIGTTYNGDAWLS
jgi:hypothetical protein